MEKRNIIIDALNTLLTRMYDAEKGYKEAAMGSKNAPFRNWLLEVSKERNDMGYKLKAEIKTLGGIPEKGSSFLAGLHRTWIDFKTDWINNDMDAIIDEIQLGEEKAIKDFNTILSSESMPLSTRILLTKQLDIIEKRLENFIVFKEELLAIS